MNVLNWLDRLLGSLQELQSFHQAVASSLSVLAANLNPTQQQIYLYLSWFKMGVEYAASEWGAGALPAGLRLEERRQLASGDIKTNFISYCATPDGKEDLLIISPLHIATRCQFLGTKRYLIEAHLPGYAIRPEHYTLLQAIEECYHCYQIKTKGYPIADLVGKDTPHHPEAPLEKEIPAIFWKAIRELNLKVVKVSLPLPQKP